MKKKLVIISLVFLVFGIILGGPLVAKGEVVQSLLIGVKQDPGGGFTNADLNGTNWFKNLSFENFETDSPKANITYGTLAFDGNGNWTGSGTEFDSDGTTDSGVFNGTYSVNDEGSYDFIITGTPPESDHTLTGHISTDADRQFSVLSEGEITSGNIHQGIVTALREPDSPFALGDLNGTWFFRDLEIQDLEENFRRAGACTATFVFNNPNWSADYNCYNSDETTDTGMTSGTYTLTENTFNLFETGDPEVLFSTYLSRDRSILIFTRGSSSGGNIEQYIGIALKESAKVFTNADLSGTYFFHDLFFADFETNNRELSITVGTITFDGTGNWTATAESFDSDGSSGSDTPSGTYSVNSDGSFTLVVTSEIPNGTLTGNISYDNNTVIMSQRENVSIGKDELAVDFDTFGLWHYNGSSWANLAGWDPEGMLEWDGGLAVDFPGYGLWNYDGTTWTSLSGWEVEEGVVWDSGVAVDFGTYGLWNYDGSNWTMLAGWDPDSNMVKRGTELAVDFGTYGLWNYDGTSWTSLAGWNPEDDMVEWGSDLVVDFGAYGLWSYDGTSWTNLAGWDPAGMLEWDGGLAVAFPGYGLWNYDGTTWTILAGWEAEYARAWNGGIAVDFGTDGLWYYDGSSWTGLAGWNPDDNMAVWVDGLAVDFGTYGLWNYDGTSWTSLAGWDPEDMIDVDLY